MKFKNKLFIFYFFSLIVIFGKNNAFAQPMRNPIVPMEFYGALSTGDTTKLNKMLDDLKYAATNNELAYKGTLLMKHASTIRSPRGLTVFNEGKKIFKAFINRVYIAELLFQYKNLD